jgi:hypothetical protein
VKEGVRGGSGGCVAVVLPSFVSWNGGMLTW